MNIPKGPYCYSEHLGKGLCPHYSSVIDGGVKIPYCCYLNDDDISHVTDEQYDSLIKKCSKGLWNEYPLNLLWDQVKECNINL